MPTELRIQTPEVFLPLLEPSRYKGAYGGRAGAKSHFFADQLIEDSILNPGLRTVCIREYQTSLKSSVKQLLSDKIDQYNLTREFRVMDSRIETPGKGLILFQGMQSHNAESIKSLEGFDRAWVEEAQSLSQRSFDLLRPTLFRKAGSQIWCSWNPRFPDDPIDDFFRGNKPRKPGDQPWASPVDSIVVRSSYRDNPWILPDLIKEINWDKARDPEKYAHVWLGEYERHSESRVFKNWTVVDFITPDDVSFLFGADWGYSVDPSVLVRCYIVGRTLYIDHEAYKVGVEVDHLPQLFDRVPSSRQWTIVADSARPETISYLQRNGFPRMIAAQKGKDSVKEGVIFLQSYDIVVHPRCTHTIDELTLYSFKVDKQTNLVTPVLEDKKNHVIDSLRYSVEPVRKPAEAGFLTW